MSCSLDRIIGSYNWRQIVLNVNFFGKEQLDARQIEAISSHFSFSDPRLSAKYAA